MRPNSYDPVEMHSSGLVVAVSVAVTLATVGLVFALQAPVVAVAAGAGAVVASSAHRLSGLRERRLDARRTRHVCVPATDVCVEV